MGHYAKIDSNNIVIQVIVANADFINTLPDKDSYIKTSYNTMGGVHYEPSDTQDFSIHYYQFWLVEYPLLFFYLTLC